MEKQGERGVKRMYAPRVADFSNCSVSLVNISASKPKGYSRWDALLLSKELAASDDAIWRLLKKEGISLNRQRSWCISTDKEFGPKAADIVGLYLDPPCFVWTRSPASRPWKGKPDILTPGNR